MTHEELLCFGKPCIRACVAYGSEMTRERTVHTA